MLDLEKMKSAAMAANTRDHNENPDWYSEDDLLGFAYYPKNARFISAVSPSAVLELIERLEKAEKQRDELLAALEKFIDSHEECTDFDGFTAQIVSMDDYHEAQESFDRAKSHGQPEKQPENESVKESK